MSEITRKLATVRKISNIQDIPDADRICLATVDGWNVVVNKGLYNVGDLAVYVEIDSFVPTTVAPFLTKDGHFPKTYNGIEGERLKTVRLRKQLSQGLILPLSVIPQNDLEWTDPEGVDVTELLDIQKWEAPISAQLAGMAKGNFPTAVPKTDQERIQNLTRAFEQWKEKDMVAEVTEKLEGSSCTMYLPIAEEDPFEVCSRNLSLKPSETNSFWQVALRYDIETKMRDAGLTGLAIQGELCGPGIQGNLYLLKEVDFYVYDIYDVKRGGYLPPDERHAIVEQLGLKHVPVVVKALKLKSDDTIQFLLKYAEGPSLLNHKQEREGLVFKFNSVPTISFKCISNVYLMADKG